MQYRDLDSNLTYDVRIETGSREESERAVKWFREHGHNVQRPWGLRDYVIVRGSSYKLGSICESVFPGMEFSMTLVSQPAGFERGEWVVMRRVGIVGTVAWEYGQRDGDRTSVNVHVGSSMWTGPAEGIVRVADLPADLQAEIMSIGEAQADCWEILHADMNDRRLLACRERAFKVATEFASA